MRRPPLPPLLLLLLGRHCRIAAGSEASCSSRPSASAGLGLLQKPSWEYYFGTKSYAQDVPSQLSRVLPIYWVHVPKCGSSFINTLVHLPGVCPHVPSSVFISESTFGRYWLDNFSKSWDMVDKCVGLKNTDFGHSGIGDDDSHRYLENRGRFMIMLRQPEERLMSAHAHMAHIWKRPGKFNVMTHGSAWGGWPTWEFPELTTFVNYAKGCVVRMLTRKGMVCGGWGGPPTSAEVKLAKRRLRQDFSFIGLTGQWALSMCLFDAMFQTGCSSFQFENTRPGSEQTQTKSPGYNLSLLEGHVDEFDGELYKTAVKIFNRNLKLHNVTEESCEPCWRSAGLNLSTRKTNVSLFED